MNYVRRTVRRLFDDPRPILIVGFGLAVFARLICDYLMNRYSIHGGELYAYRHPFWLPLYSPPVLILEWIFTAAAGAMFVLRKNLRIAGAILFLAMAASISQMFQHQKMLFLIVAGSFVVESFDRNQRTNERFLKLQLLIVYLFSAASKLVSAEGFGSSFVSALSQSAQASSWRVEFLEAAVSLVSNFSSVGLAISAAAIEFGVALALVFAPRVGFVLAITFHLALAVLLADVLPFSILMISLASLFLDRQNARDGVARAVHGTDPSLSR